MAKPPFLDEEQLTAHRSPTWVASADGDGRLPAKWCQDEHRWLHNSAEQLERQLRWRTIALAGALALNAFLGSFLVSSFYKSERPTVAVAATPSLETLSSSPSVTRKVEQPSQFERSETWALGEERIEEIAALHFDAQRMQAATDQRTTMWRNAGGSDAVEAEGSARGKIRGERSEAVARDCSPPSPETVVSASFDQDGSRAAQPNERLHYAATDFVNLRAAPSNSAEVLAVVAQGDLVRQTGRDLGWLQVEYSNRSTRIKGWVYSGNLRRVDTLDEPAL